MIIVKAIENIGERFFKKSFDNIRDTIEKEIMKDPKSSYEYLVYLSKIGQLPLFKNIKKIMKSAEDYLEKIPVDMISFVTDYRSQEQIEDEVLKKLEEEEENKEYEPGMRNEDINSAFIVANDFLEEKISQYVRPFVENIALRIASSISSQFSFSEKNKIDESLISEVNPFIDYSEKDIKSFGDFFAGLKDDDKREQVFESISKKTYKIVNNPYSFRFFMVFLKEKMPNLYGELEIKVSPLLDKAINFEALSNIKDLPKYKREIQRFNEFLNYIHRNLRYTNIKKIDEIIDDVKREISKEKIDLETFKKIKDKIIELIYISTVYKVYEKEIDNVDYNVVRKIILNKTMGKYKLPFSSKEILKDYILTGEMPENTNMEVVLENLDFSHQYSKIAFVKILTEMIIDVRNFNFDDVIVFINTVLENKKNKKNDISLMDVDFSLVSAIALDYFKKNFTTENEAIEAFERVVKFKTETSVFKRDALFFDKLAVTILNAFFNFGKNFEVPLPQIFAVLVDYKYPYLKNQIKSFGYYFKKSFKNLDVILKKLKIRNYE